MDTEENKEELIPKFASKDNSESTRDSHTRNSNRRSSMRIYDAITTFIVQNTNRLNDSVLSQAPNPLDAIYTITNKDTGMSLDFRKVHEDSFASSFRTLTAGNEQEDDIEDYIQQTQVLTEQLWDAAESNDYERIRDLLDPTIFKNAMAEVNATGSYQYTALHLANNQGHAEACEAILQYGQRVYVNWRTKQMRTPLHLACIRGYTDCARILLAAGARLDVMDNDGNTPLHFASQNSMVDSLKFLLSKDPDLNIKNGMKKTAQQLATEPKIIHLFFIHQQKKEKKGYARYKIKNQLIPTSRIDQVARILKRVKEAEPQTSEVLEAFWCRPKLADIQSIMYASKLKSEINVSNVNVSKFAGSEIESKRTSFASQHSTATVRKPPTPDDYELIGTVGSGSFGDVFLVKSKIDGKTYALKSLKKSVIISRKLIRYAMTERNVLAQLYHPFMIRLHNSFQSHDRLILVMEYCERGDLGDLLHIEKRFSEQRARDYLWEIILALEYLHKRDILFRDLKPDNILIAEDGHLKLADFGLAKELEDEDERTYTFCGTTSYLPPEVVDKMGHGKAMDWYMIGVFLHEMITGAPPYYCEDKDEMMEHISRHTLQLPTDISPEAYRLLTALLAKDPNTRLGARGSEEVKTHEYFADVDWGKVYRKEIQMPKPPKKNTNYVPRYEEVFGFKSDYGSRKIEGFTWISM